METEHKSIELKYVILILRTKRFLALMDRLGRRRITGPLAWVMLYIMPIAAGFAFFLEFVQLSVILSPQGASVIQYIRSLTPTVNLLIPGINPYLPVVYGWLALIVAMVVHEGAHGVVARSLNMPVKSAGLLFFLIFPIGAFVEVDEKELKVARARDSSRVLAAGAGVNFLLAVVCIALLFNTVSTMTPAANGAAVLSVYQSSSEVYSPANAVGIRPGDYLLSMNNVPIYKAVNDSTVYSPGNKVNLTIWRSGETIVLRNVSLGNVSYIDLRTNKTFVRAFIGVQTISSADLQQKVDTYLGAFRRAATPYVCVPTFPRCQDFVPFSDQFVGFYKSPLGGGLPILLNLLFWLYFINFNLAIFNSLPIYPLDGGQAFAVALKTIGRGRLGETTLNRITTTVSVLLVSMIAFLILGPYFI